MIRGRASRFAYDPKVLVAFLDAHTEHLVTGTPLRRRRIINGRTINTDIDARTIRRWRSGRVEGVTYEAAKRLFRRTGFKIQDFYDWCDSRSTDPVLRNTNRRP